MKIKFLNQLGNCNDSGSGRGRSPHYDNLDYLDNNPALKTSMENALKSYFNSFFYSKPYMNSGKVSVEVCRAINVTDDKFHHGLVGSLIYNTFVNIKPTAYGLGINCEVIASKGQNQHYVDYFLPR